MNAYEVILEGGSPWGIRLQGGADYNTPIKIAQVTPGSKAELKGVVVGSELFAINGNKTEYLSMSQAQTLIKVTGDELVLSLRIYVERFPNTKFIIMEGGRPWGLRLQGGKNSGIPLQIGQVAAGSKADHKGLHIGDQILSINDICIEQYTMIEAQDLIKETGYTLKLGMDDSPRTSNGPVNGESNVTEEEQKKAPFMNELKESMVAPDPNWGRQHEAKGNTFKSLQEHTDAGLGQNVLTVFDVAASDRNKSIPILAPRVIKERKESVNDAESNAREDLSLGCEITMVGGKPWGIRLQGGKDSGIPLQIASVTENSKSATVGLQARDHIISINDTDSSELTLLDAQNLIKDTGDKLKLRIMQMNKATLIATKKSIGEDNKDDSFYEDLKVSMQGCSVDRSGRNVKGQAFKMLQNIVDSGTVK